MPDAHDFYVTGGTLGQNTPSYVPRRADDELFDGLRRGEFCYVLTSRQMGKSSLMVRTAARLRTAGATVVVLDLTGIGVNVTPEQWYDGLLARLARQLDLENELEAFWGSHERLSPVQRWMQAVQSVALPRCPGGLVIFVDEIDAVRSLPFSADEFFSAVRECHNRRSVDERLDRLTFCLLGVATPSELIRDPRITPFNIGRRIELNDFSAAEAARLAGGLGHQPAAAARLLSRILFWTGGQPYLTQRLCQAVAAESAAGRAANVDRVCHAVFLAPGARERDDNLAYVRQRMLRGEQDVAGVLDLYRQIQRGHAVPDEPNPLVNTLALSGIVRSVDGILRARNQIYRRVFDRAWIAASMPDAELRRQRAAFRRGLLRATAIASVFILVLSGSVLFAVWHWQRAEAEAANTRMQSLLTERARKEADERRLDAETARRQAELLGEQAVQARKSAEQARDDEKRQRLVAEVARDAERQQREIAEKALADAVTQRRLADRARREAEEAWGVTRDALDRARAAGDLFAALLPWLQEHAAESYAKHWQSLVTAGKKGEAVASSLRFYQLTTGSGHGLLTSELLNLQPHEVQLLNLDRQLVEVKIAVPPAALLTRVLEPAIRLGEDLAQATPAAEAAAVKRQVAQLQAAKGQLLYAHRQQGGELAIDDPLLAALAAFDRAIELDGETVEYPMVRAAVRYLQPNRDLLLVLADIGKAIAIHTTAAGASNSVSATDEQRRVWLLLLTNQARVLEQVADREPSDRAEPRYAEATQSFEAALVLAPNQPDLPIDLARCLRKQAARLPSRDRAEQFARQAQQLLDAARAKQPQSVDVAVETGLLQLAQARPADACQTFATAARTLPTTTRASEQYRCFTGWALAATTEPTDEASLRAAVTAAEKAISLQPGLADGHFFLGFAQWRLKRQAAAIASLEEALRRAPKHLDALLVRCQIVFEDRAATPAQLQRAHQDLKQTLEIAVTNEERSRVHYVYSLAWLQHFVASNSESSLVNCLRDLLAAIKNSPRPSRTYRQTAAGVFAAGQKLDWKGATLRDEFFQVRKQIEAVTAGNSGR